MFRALASGRSVIQQNALLNSLVSYWKLDEASGTRYDSHGTNHLADNNTVTQTDGKLGNASQFTAANSEYLSIADTPALSMGIGQPFTLACWFRLRSFVAGQGFMTKWSGEYFLGLDGGNLWFYVNDGTTTRGAAPQDFAPSLNVWYFVRAWYDGASVNCRVNEGPYQTQFGGNGAQDGNTLFSIGSLGGSLYFADCDIDSAIIWKRYLTDAEGAQVYNGGAGLDYPF